MKNIVLIGMPGSGKTTISKVLGEKLNKEVIDIDEYLVNKFQMSIPDMFNISEDYFRERETICCKEVSQKDGIIISCGGGVVKRSENIEALKETGIIYFLERSCENIIGDVDISTRPLLQEGKNKIYTLFNERHELYLNSASVVIDNNRQLDDAINDIINHYLG